MADLIELDAVVIGGGVVGLAVARALALQGREVTLVEAEATLGSHSSSRNSEVIHAGIYYEPGSLKARLCVAGKLALYQYCERMGVPHERIGKIIVATRDEEVAVLERLKSQAEANGVSDLEWLDSAQIKSLEPNILSVRGLLSPSTGIIDSHGFMVALRRESETNGAHVILSTPVMSGTILESGFELAFGGVEPCTATCRTVVNAAGLRAQEVARSLSGFPPERIPKQHFAKGHYFTLNGPAPFSRLVYPVPVPGGLGVHVTLDMGHRARFGPDVAWVPDVDYGFDERRVASFYSAIRSYYPALADGALVPGYTGVRPKLGAAGAPAQDFVLHGPSTHGIAGLVHLYGIESPGLTSSLALADLVLEALDDC